MKARLEELKLGKKALIYTAFVSAVELHSSVGLAQGDASLTTDTIPVPDDEEDAGLDL